MVDLFEQQIQQELNFHESIIWQGFPEPRAYAFQFIELSIFSIPWLIITILMTVGSLEINYGFAVSTLFDLAFVLIGLAMLFNPVFYYLKANKVVYVITNLRAFEMYCGKETKVTNFYPLEIGGLQRVEKPDRSGNLYFATEVPDDGNRNHEKKVGFLGIKDVKLVESYINTLKDSSDINI